MSLHVGDQSLVPEGLVGSSENTMKLYTSVGREQRDYHETVHIRWSNTSRLCHAKANCTCRCGMWLFGFTVSVYPVPSSAFSPPPSTTPLYETVSNLLKHCLNDPSNCSTPSREQLTRCRCRGTFDIGSSFRY